MQLIYTPVALPGCCFICRAAQRDAYVDTLLSKDYEGAVYICNLCVGEMATLFAYLSFDEYKDLRASKEELERLNFELIKRVGDLENAIESLDRAGFVVRDGSVLRRGGYAAKNNEVSGEDVSSSETELGVGEGTVTESSNDSQLDGLQSSESESDFSFDLQ
jgi:hypothetical protein